mmetsp:Transcript_34148/g.69812  ORF Transcript_34148/g.69812 Transcript_34148/m.69812 type:complete len:668 (+) Transcript_34148:123-2126(+)
MAANSPKEGWYPGKTLSRLFSKKNSDSDAPSVPKEASPPPLPPPSARADGIQDEGPQASPAGHRTDKAANKLATALAAKYLFELNPSRSHKSNIHALLTRELHDLTRQALAFRTARLPPRVLCRLNAFIANLCAAVPESPLPAAFSRFGSAASRRALEASLEASEDPSMVLAQISEEDLKQRLECYISALWASANTTTQGQIAKDAYKGNPKAAAAAELEAGQALLAANQRADAARTHGTATSFTNGCVAQAALVPNMTLLQNIRPRMLLTPLVECLCREVLGVPDVDANTREKIAALVAAYERQHSFFQTAEANAKRVLEPLLVELVDWLRKNEDSLVANSATEGMLSVIPDDLRIQLKTQVYYSAEHFLEVFNTLRPRLCKLPIPLHPLLEDTTMDAAQAMKDMHRERLTLNGSEVNPGDVPRLLSDCIHALLDNAICADDLLHDRGVPVEKSASPVKAEAADDGGNGAGRESVPSATLSASPAPVAAALDLPEEAVQRHNRVHASLTEHLVMRTINAASRTTSGGDAFFIVQDLYGGDGVLVKQSSVTAPPIEITCNANGIGVRSQDSYEIYHEQEVAEAENAFPLMIMHTAMSEVIPIPSPDIIRRYMSRREISFQGDMSRDPDVVEGIEVLASDGEAVTVRRFLSLDAVRPKRPRRPQQSSR